PILNAFQSTKRGINDAFVAKLNADASALVYSSYLGGSHCAGCLPESTNVGRAIAVNVQGNAYVTGRTISSNFPTTPDAFQPALGGGSCFFGLSPCPDAFVTKIAAEGPGVIPDISLSVTPTTVPVGGTVTATWAGLSAPTPNDELRLFVLGAVSSGTQTLAVW